MPMDRVGREEALSKAAFHQRLREWLEGTDDAQIGSEDEPGVTSWVHVRDGAVIFALRADTKLAAVEWYLQRVAKYGDDILWSVTESRQHNQTAVAHGPERERNESFYLYVVGSDTR